MRLRLSLHQQAGGERWDDYCRMPASGSHCHTLFTPPSIESTNTVMLATTVDFPVVFVLRFAPFDTPLFTQCYYTVFSGITHFSSSSSPSNCIIPLDTKSFASPRVSRALVPDCSQAAGSLPTCEVSMIV